MPEKDYITLLSNAMTSNRTADVLLSGDPEKIGRLLKKNPYHFTPEEIAFLRTVNATSLPGFASQTEGYWRD